MGRRSRNAQVVVPRACPAATRLCGGVCSSLKRAHTLVCTRRWAHDHVHKIPIMKLTEEFATPTIRFQESGKSTEAKSKRLRSLEACMQPHDGTMCVDVAVLETDGDADREYKRKQPQMRGRCKLAGILRFGMPRSSTKQECANNTTDSLTDAWSGWRRQDPDAFARGYHHVTKGLGPNGAIWQYPSISGHHFSSPIAVRTPAMRDFLPTGGARIQADQ